MGFLDKLLGRRKKAAEEAREKVAEPTGQSHNHEEGEPHAHPEDTEPGIEPSGTSPTPPA